MIPPDPPDDSKRQLARYYRESKAYRDHLRDKSEKRFQRFVALIARYAPPGARVLEIGCGAGQAARMLQRAGFTVAAVDLSPLFLREALSSDVERRIRWAACDAARLPFADRSFDVAAGYELIEHMPDAPAALDEMLRVVRVGGLAIVRSPALASPVWPLIDLPSLLWRGGPGRPPHYSNRREAARFFAANLARTARELIQPRAGFEPRAPKLSEAEVGGDRDAACWTSALAIARRLRGNGARILQMAGEGPRFAPARLAGRLAPWLLPTVAVVARRER